MLLPEWQVRLADNTARMGVNETCLPYRELNTYLRTSSAEDRNGLSLSPTLTLPPPPPRPRPAPAPATAAALLTWHVWYTQSSNFVEVNYDYLTLLIPISMLRVNKPVSMPMHRATKRRMEMEIKYTAFLPAALCGYIESTSRFCPGK